MASTRSQFEFCECEHYGDLDNYEADIIASGGCVINRDLNYEEETATVLVTHSPDFWEKFKETDAYQYLN